MSSSGEKQFTLASKDGENYFDGSVKPRRNQLARRCLYCLFIGMLVVGIFLLKLSGFIVYIRFNNPSSITVVKPEFSTGQYNNHDQCPQVDPLSPKHTSFRLNVMDRYLSSPRYEDYSANLLSKAIQYQTVSYESMADPDYPLDGPLFRPFRQFVDRFIRSEFPRISEKLYLEHINRHGLLYTWAGNTNLPPTVLLSHTDVVPVEEESIAEWAYDPWKGEIADGRVWGRGSFEGKHAIVGILEAVEALIAADFVPRRTILLSFGFDGEIGGQRGAVELAKVLRERYNRAAVILDEGGTEVTQ